MTRALAASGCLLFCSVLLLPVAAIAGDEDRRPAYMIYIDPVTGKYTTEDPENPDPDGDEGPTALPSAEHDTEKKQWDLPMLLLAGGVVVAMLVGAYYRQQRKPLS